MIETVSDNTLAAIPEFSTHGALRNHSYMIQQNLCQATAPNWSSSELAQKDNIANYALTAADSTQLELDLTYLRRHASDIKAEAVLNTGLSTGIVDAIPSGMVKPIDEKLEFDLKLR